jgi:hypothetical protein
MFKLIESSLTVKKPKRGIKAFLENFCAPDRTPTSCQEQGWQYLRGFSMWDLLREKVNEREQIA